MFSRNLADDVGYSYFTAEPLGATFPSSCSAATLSLASFDQRQQVERCGLFTRLYWSADWTG